MLAAGSVQKARWGLPEGLEVKISCLVDRRYRTASVAQPDIAAHKQGRIAGENAIGGSREFAGSLGTQIVKIFDHAAARTGLRDHEATAAGFDLHR